MFDLVITGGTLIDGTGTAGRRADVGVVRDRIEAIGDLGDAAAATRLDATGKVVAPGFIDVHTHTDWMPLIERPDPDDELASLRQGVTTEVCGNCGFSPFPITGAAAASMSGMLQSAVGPGSDVYADYASYRQALGERRMPVNLAPLVGHGAIRAGVMGFDDRAPTGDELGAMRDRLDECLADGAFGMSSGLIYPPGMFAGTSELVELARVLHRRGRPYTTHMRNEANGVEDAVAEALRIGRDSGAAVQISHHKVAERHNWGRSERTLAMIEAARADGVDVTFDVYPYTASSTAMAALLPRWVLDGGLEGLAGRVAAADVRARIRAESEAAAPGAGCTLIQVPDCVVISGAAGRPDLEGRRLTDIAGVGGVDPFELACDLLVDDPTVSVILHKMDDGDVRRILAHPLAMIGSDGGMGGGGKPHPRRAGTFARVLGRYVRETGLLGLVEAVQKMTGAGAARFGLGDRGLLAVGKRADVVVFDPATVVDGATFDEPLLPPVGVRHVVVNGEVAVLDAQSTGARAGRVLAPR